MTRRFGARPSNEIDNLSAVVNPGVTDDAAHNYGIDSLWVNTITKKAYICVDSTTGAAVWEPLADPSDTTVELPHTVFAAPDYPDMVLALVPAAYWRMGESSGDLVDYTGHANTMTVHGTPTYSLPGAITGDSNTALSLPGNAANYFEAANSASLDVADTFSIVAWVKTSSAASMCIVSRRMTGYALYVGPVTAGRFALVKDWVAIIVESTVTVNDGNWHMVAATKSGATSKLYIDGVDRTGVVTNQTIVATATVTQIGRDASGASQPFNGSLDEIAIFPVALTAAQIAALYTASAGLPKFRTLDTTDLPDNIRAAGYVRVGSNAIPSNTAAGDLTCVRLSVGNTAIATNIEAQINGDLHVTGACYFDGIVAIGGNVGFYGTGSQAKQTVTGLKGGNAALGSLLTALATYGLIVDSSGV